MTTTESLTAERQFLELIDTAEGWKLIERFSELVRESGTRDESAAADYIVERLEALQVPCTRYEPELFISLPRGAGLTAASGGDTRTLRAKTPSFSLATNGQPRSGPVRHLSSEAARATGDIFVNHLRAPDEDVAGTIVVTEGFSMPTTVRALEGLGALAVIFVNPGEDIHEMICTTIWGNPTPHNLGRKPGIPVVNINRPDGEWLIEQANSGSVEATVETQLDEGWRKCSLPVAHIDGSEQPEQFLLVHGHYDSWHVGIGDNATGNAALLELARVFHQRRDLLKRSLRIAWWPGHSTGRYAGSTWFADQFALQLRRHCIGQVNVDSPGCRGATSFEEVMWMAECESLCREVIQEHTSEAVGHLRPLRAGDYSFNQIGLSSYFMLLSNRPEAERRDLGFYPVGGCGGDTAWHTERDTLDVADPRILKQDLEIYVSAITRTVNARVLPFDFRRTVEELREGVTASQQTAGAGFTLEPVVAELDTLQEELDRFYARLERVADSETAAANQILLELGRRLVPLNYSLGERFDHDPAEPLGVIPKLRDVAALPDCSQDSAERKFLENHLVRQRNKVVNSLYETTEMVRCRRRLLG